MPARLSLRIVGCFAVLLGALPAIAQVPKSGPPSTAQECTWKTENWGAVLELPPGSGRVTDVDDPGRRGAEIGQIHIEPLGRTLDLVAYVYIRQETGAPK